MPSPDDHLQTLPAELLLLIHSFLDDPADLCCLALTSTRLARVAARKPESLILQAPFFERLGMPSALPDGHARCKLCCKGWPTDADDWEEYMDTLIDWTSFSRKWVPGYDYYDHIDKCITCFCEKECMFRDSFDDEIEGETLRLVGEKMGLRSKDNDSWCGRLCPACNLQINWETDMLKMLLVEAGYRENSCHFRYEHDSDDTDESSDHGTVSDSKAESDVE